jgi:HAD superfamily hydrolase (TIGR01509 family)
MNKTSPRIRAVIYDVDGTMVDSEPLHIAAWDKTLQRYGFTLSDVSKEFQATMAGKKPIAIAEHMINELRVPVAATDFLETKTKLFTEAAKTGLKGMPGVTESVGRLKEAGYLLAIGTSLDRNYVNMVLGRLGLEVSFSVIVTGDQIKNGKPDPETYLTVAKQLGIDPSECVVLEDARSGIQSAKAAGAWCIAIENPNAVPQDTSEADIVVQSLGEVTQDLISKLIT